MVSSFLRAVFMEKVCVCVYVFLLFFFAFLYPLMKGKWGLLYNLCPDLHTFIVPVQAARKEFPEISNWLAKASRISRDLRYIFWGLTKQNMFKTIIFCQNHHH